MNALKTYEIRTFGCQMNKHDSERVAGLLRAADMLPAPSDEPADVYVFMTCCVRENADERLRGQVSSLKALKTGGHPDTLIAVGGCIGQRDGERLLHQLPHVDVVFGTHNVAHLPELLETARRSKLPAIEILDSSAEFTSDLPSEREHPWHAWVPITMGCDNFCTYCIVPYVRGRERSRPLDDIVREAEALVADGVLEITLLGQNVNSYGRDLYGEPRFATVLQRVAETGVHRIRFATSHPKDLTEETIHVMASTPQVCRSLHLPVQSGSDRILKAMNRVYTQTDYLSLVDRLYAAMPDLALSTDIIVGFPGETEQDFLATIDVVRHARYDQAFTFLYSPRVGTPAAEMREQLPHDVVQERFERLVEIVHTGALSKNLALVGTVQEVLVEGGSKRDSSLITGRTCGNKVVHAPLRDGVLAESLGGTMVDVRVQEAQTWFLSGTIVGTY
ncbi:MAG: tRNA (N6-isopentenyl adenosine(37)-C2)-methylthiotransferase MiaB [Actinobacteria bacterium HGW-Actinobacteria-9]|jgi:tRNA-2-methylthio-N6-dimethylallyladenosine synthase|nr:MAG: tRNA (N6-isopentenyl adenosine(37)-C2)-methylthiotransferase MiaB [Actinobacteria bacterium HGW-Actinobacteria-9]